VRNNYKKLTEEILGLAGIKINGSDPWDIQVHDEGFYRRAITEGQLGVGESYMDGWWDAEKVDELIYRILKAKVDEKLKKNLSFLFRFLLASLINMQSKGRAYIVGEKHYDLGNDLFVNMLDQGMNYSCAYWENARDLDEAQRNKLELICRKLYMKPGMHVLDIGCGWSAFGKYAAENYDVQVTGITVSREQVKLGKQLCEGLPVEIRLADYRELNEKYDRIVSVGMFEHVGYKNYRTFFKTVNRCLKENGLFLLHTIGNVKSVKTTNQWTGRYIFPNGMTPSVAQIGKAAENLFVIEDLHNIGADYDRTLMAWYNNFITNREKIKDNYSDRFFRMWKYFLLSCAGSFRARRNQCWQIVMSKDGVEGGYRSVRDI
jgi:cyclopropane-fatty-acyl-phospholipid synthase